MNIYNMVKGLLEKYPALRDSDKKLIWSVWIKLGSVKNGAISMDNYLKAEIEESITRARRMVQEHHSELSSSVWVTQLREKKEKIKGIFIYDEEVVPPTPELLSGIPEKYKLQIKKILHK